MKKRRVMGFGTFDAVHPGHLFYLRELKKLGDELIIVIARDKNVEKIKGKMPHFSEELRKKHIEEAGIADKVILGDLEDFYKPVRDFAPEVLGLGYDQKADIKKLHETFPKLEVKHIKAHHPDKYKSSIMKAKLNRI